MLSTKEQLIKKIGMLEDEAQLSLLNDAADAYLASNHYDDLTTEQYERLEKSMDEIKRGNFITHEEMQVKMKKWSLK